jgi:futalosine hydrolase
MNLLLCAATEFEIRPMLDLIKEGKIRNVDVLITGVGLTAATYALAKSVLTKRPRFILQAGIAGCLDTKFPLTKIVLVRSETIGDLGVAENGGFQSLFDLKLLQLNEHPWKNGKLINPIETLVQAGLTTVDAVTINEISTDAHRISFYRDELGASVESMEGAALHFVALMENIPFLQIRSLSNFAGERDKSKWMIPAAISALNMELHRILTKL